ncbi:MAG TPA: hypothetical protein VK009_07300 [Chloroflexota bacterium]|nr:hypothetical protein [Chloroflexota bacterium]
MRRNGGAGQFGARSWRRASFGSGGKAQRLGGGKRCHCGERSG